MSSHRDAMIETLITWTQVAGEHPTEITLPRVVYLRLAQELGIDDPDAAPDYCLPLQSCAFRGPPLPGTRTAELVRAGNSFVFRGPHGSVIVKKATDLRRQPKEPHNG